MRNNQKNNWSLSNDVSAAASTTLPQEKTNNHKEQKQKKRETPNVEEEILNSSTREEEWRGRGSRIYQSATAHTLRHKTATVRQEKTKKSKNNSNEGVWK